MDFKRALLSVKRPTLEDISVHDIYPESNAIAHIQGAIAEALAYKWISKVPQVSFPETIPSEIYKVVPKGYGFELSTKGRTKTDFDVAFQYIYPFIAEVKSNGLQNMENDLARRIQIADRCYRKVKPKFTCFFTYNTLDGGEDRRIRAQGLETQYKGRVQCFNLNYNVTDLKALAQELRNERSKLN